MRRATPLATALAIAALAMIACGESRAPGGASSGKEPDAGPPPAPTAAPEAGKPDTPAPEHDAATRPPPEARPPADRATVKPPEAGAAPSADAGAPTDSGTAACHGPGARFATGSPDHGFGPGQNNGQDRFPALVLGPPKGGGACQGSTDVVSLGNGGYVVLEFDGNAIVDGPGPDFIVFENPFGASCDLTKLFVELATVSVSDDGVTWTDFPCRATAAPYGLCSGVHPVYANADDNDIDPTDPTTAGGDPYDLADIGVERARYVRVTDRPDLTGMAGVYDLDAVAIVNAACP